MVNNLNLSVSAGEKHPCCHYLPFLVLEGKSFPEINFLVLRGEFWHHVHFHGKQIYRRELVKNIYYLEFTLNYQPQTRVKIKSFLTGNAILNSVYSHPFLHLKTPKHKLSTADLKTTWHPNTSL